MGERLIRILLKASERAVHAASDVRDWRLLSCGSRWRALVVPVPLSAIRTEPKLAAIELLRQSRLSVSPVRDDEFLTIVNMGAEG